MYHDHTTLREWEERFDERFIPNDGGIPTYIENGNDLKEFIHQELQKAREEEREQIIIELEERHNYVNVRSTLDTYLPLENQKLNKLI
jgi:hypothetical protein